jgi:AraC-like DNA-binding protein
MIPFLLLSALTAAYGSVFSVHTMESSGPGVRLPFTLMDISTLVSMTAYAVASLRMIRDHRVRLRQYFSNITPARSLLWLNAMNWVFVIYLLPPTLMHSGLVESTPPPHSITTGIFILYLLMISLFIIRQGPIYSTQPEKIPEEQPQTEERETRYERSLISGERMTQIEASLLALMTAQKPHLNEDLDLPALASQLQVTPHQLSQTLNLRIGKSFHTFVNEYRVREAEARLADPAYADYPILRIALESGFNSKSSFHARFRKVKGISPGEFRAGVHKPAD